MRIRLSVAAAVSLALLAAIPAMAAVRDEHTFKLKLSAKTPKKSTSVTFSTVRNPAPPAPGTKPPRVAKIVFALPTGTKFNTAAATRCSLSALQAQGAAGCKAGTAIGGGSAVADTGTLLGSVTQQVAVYATTTGLVAVLTGLQTAVLPLTVKANKITAVLPRICLPPGTPANDCASGEVVLKSLDVTLKARTKGTGSRTRRLVTTPAKCAGGRWKSRATYTFANGDTEAKTSISKCRA
ncbi:MAG: hypothetical protein M3376_13120 [Actinomycetota bacterium]|nr:hypothetical protein [Actinomycetota bacterium]